MLTRATFVLAVVAAGCRHGAPAPTAATLPASVPALMALHHVPGLALARLTRGRAALIDCFGFADARTRAPVRGDTIFEAASLSKPLYAYALVREAAAGHLDLDRPLTADLAPPYRHARHAGVDELGDARLGAINARVALAHQTGFPNWSLEAPLGITFAPGSRWSYSSEGYVYLQRAVEKHLDEALEPFMVRVALGPLGMSRSSYANALELPASGHDRAGRVVESALTTPPFDQPLASTTLRTTVADYARFVQRLLDAAPDDAVVAALLRPVAEVGAFGLAWSLGLGIERHADGDWFFHAGSNPGFRALVVGSRARGEALVLLSNGDDGLEVELEIARGLLGEHGFARFLRARQ